MQPGYNGGRTGALYRFAPYTGAREESLIVEEHQAQWVVRSRRRLEVRAQRAQAGLLQGPGKSDMGLRVPETL